MAKYTKSMAALTAESGDGHALKRTLGPVNLVMLGIGAIIGAGLFVRTAAAAANNAGPSVTIAFIVAGLGCAFAGLCYAELASMIPIAGSAYTYTYATLGERMAWVIGWDLVLEYAIGAATVSIAWSEYLNNLLKTFFDISIPYSLSHSPFEHAVIDGVMVSGSINLPALFIVLVLSLLLIRGTQESAFVNGIIVITKVAIVLLIIGLGWSFVNPVHHTPYIPEASTYVDSVG
ncbi:MAG: amino acid permease, partial [Candidatus Kapaibacterium sp.]